MEAKLSKAARKLEPSPIQELSHLAQRVGAVNLAEGFPDFPAPLPLKAAAVAAIDADINQYRHVQGVCELLAVAMKQNHGIEVDPATDIVICCGQSEAFAATIFAKWQFPAVLIKGPQEVFFSFMHCLTAIDQGDEVLLFDPAYETYESCIILAGGVPVYVPLDPPFWTLNLDRFMNSFTSRTKAVVLNSPHNPTGKIFSEKELQGIAAACCQRDCLAITDEVYEFILYGKEKHISLASLPGMQERTVITSSISKTFSVTGWRIGWAIAPSSIAFAIRNVHIKLIDSAPAPFQEAALTALSSPPEYFKSLKAEYEERREFVIQMLAEIGFEINFIPHGSVFIFAELPQNWLSSDIDFVKQLIQKAGVAAVPGRGFFHADSEGHNHHNRYVRFAFCKSRATLHAAAEKIRSFVKGHGRLEL